MDEIKGIMKVKQFTGRAKEQCDEFLLEVKEIIEHNRELLGMDVLIEI